MKKQELIDHIAEEASLSKAQAENALKAMVGGITSALQKGDSVVLLGFGTFSVKERAARDGYNPIAKKKIRIQASRGPAFKAGKALKDAVK